MLLKSQVLIFFADTNVCSSDSCMNGGTCELQDDGSNFTCRCTDGFTGLRCESGKNIFTVCKNMCLCTSLLMRAYLLLGLFLYLFSEQQSLANCTLHRKI